MNENPDSALHLTVSLTCEDDTLQFAARIWQIVRVGDIIALWGELGVGKTAFARGFIQAAIGSNEEVPSPTFTLLQTYDAPTGMIHHFDLYRIDYEDDVLELSIDDAFADGISLIEWPGNMGHWLPRNRLDLELEMVSQASGRIARLSSQDPIWQARLAAMDLQG